MDKELILCNLKPGVLHLQEEWDVSFKKHRGIFIFLGLLPLSALIISIVILISRHDVDGFLACVFMGVAALLIFFGPMIIKYFRPKHYEISTRDGRLTIIKNGKEIVNTSIESVKQIKLTINQLYDELQELTIYYTNEKKRKRSFKMNLAFIPDDDQIAMIKCFDPKLAEQTES